MVERAETEGSGDRGEEMGRRGGLLVAHGPAPGLSETQGRLRRMVLDAVTSPQTRRAYAKALDDLFAFSAGRPLSRERARSGT